MTDNDIRAHVADVPVPVFEQPAFTAAPDLANARVAIVTTAGLHLAHQPRWERRDEGFRVLPPSTDGLVLGHLSPNYDRTGFLNDVNVVFPIDRLHELAAEGVIGSVAAQHLSFLGAQDEVLSTIRLDTGPAAAQLLRDDGVDVVLLTPVCPLCTRTSGFIAHVLEAEGLATTAISLVRGQTERLQPPRALFCEFPLGRPLGRPGDPAFQRRVLEAAFSLLERPAGPVLEDFPEAISDDTDVPVECVLPPRFDPSLPPEVDEAMGLRSAYDRQLAATGRTVVGRGVDVDAIPDAVRTFAAIADGADWRQLELPASLRNLAADVRGYYEEAALALAGHVPAAHATEAWFFRKTKAGDSIRRAQVQLRDAGAEKEEWFFLVPRGQQNAAN